MPEEIAHEANEDVSQLPRYWLPDKAYAALKWIGLLALPTLSWMYQALAQVWGWPHATEVTMTLGIAGTAIAVLIGASSLKARGGADGRS